METSCLNFVLRQNIKTFAVFPWSICNFKKNVFIQKTIYNLFTWNIKGERLILSSAFVKLTYYNGREKEKKNHYLSIQVIRIFHHWKAKNSLFFAHSRDWYWWYAPIQCLVNQLSGWTVTLKTQGREKDIYEVASFITTHYHLRRDIPRVQGDW